MTNGAQVQEALALLQKTSPDGESLYNQLTKLVVKVPSGWRRRNTWREGST